MRDNLSSSSKKPPRAKIQRFT